MSVLHSANRGPFNKKARFAERQVSLFIVGRAVSARVVDA